MPIIMLKNVTLAFPAIAKPEAVGDGAPAYSARYIIDPSDAENIALIEAALKQAADEKWNTAKNEEGAKKAQELLDFLTSEKKVCFSRAEYRSSKTGKVYGGFEGMFHIGTRHEKTKPTAVDRQGAEMTNDDEIARTFYSGCKVHAKVEIWAQDNQYGRRINGTTTGVMFAGEGQHFGGGSGAASASDFAGLASDANEFI